MDGIGARPPAGAAVHPDWLAAAWPGLPNDARAHLAACPRVQARLAALVAARLGVDAPEPSAAETDAASADAEEAARLARLPADELWRAGLLAGAAWHARSVRLLVEAEAVGALLARIGAEARAFALTNASLAAAPGERLAAAALAERIAGAARHCLGVWLAGLPAGLRACARLRLPRNLPEAAGDDAAAVGPIMRRVAQAVS